MKVVILCGGQGTRLKEETEFKPKPLVEIGSKPILWHIMKTYSRFGYNDFVLCLGYKGSMIKDYFINYDLFSQDFTLNLGTKEKKLHGNSDVGEWNITFADTGSKTLTAGRIKKIEKYINEDNFMLTYGDGVANIDLRELYNFHLSKNKMVTLTGVRPSSKYGLIRASDELEVLNFEEKPQMNDLINGGFMVFKKDFLDQIKEDCMFESKILPTLSGKREIALYKHEGFWHCMDTYKDYLDLNRMWRENRPWKI